MGCQFLFLVFLVSVVGLFFKWLIFFVGCDILSLCVFRLAITVLFLHFEFNARAIAIYFWDKSGYAVLNGCSELVLA